MKGAAKAMRQMNQKVAFCAPTSSFLSASRLLDINQFSLKARLLSPYSQTDLAGMHKILQEFERENDIMNEKQVLRRRRLTPITVTYPFCSFHGISCSSISFCHCVRVGDQTGHQTRSLLAQPSLLRPTACPPPARALRRRTWTAPWTICLQRKGRRARWRTSSARQAGRTGAGSSLPASCHWVVGTAFPQHTAAYQVSMRFFFTFGGHALTAMPTPIRREPHGRGIQSSISVQVLYGNPLPCSTWTASQAQTLPQPAVTSASSARRHRHFLVSGHQCPLLAAACRQSPGPVPRAQTRDPAPVATATRGRAREPDTHAVAGDGQRRLGGFGCKQ